MFKEDLYSDYTIFHAVGKGLTYISESRFKQNNEIVALFPVTIPDELFSELLEDCHKNAGLKYGFLQNIGIGLVRLANKVGIKVLKNPLNDGINCSEWLYYLLEEIYGKWTDTEPNLVAPDEVYDYLKGMDTNG